MIKPRLLAIEDDPIMASLVCRIAAEAGYSARYVSSLSISVAYETFRPDVVVLDILMPDIDGFEILQFLGRRSSKARIVLLSGSDRAYRRMAENLAQGLGLVIDASVQKPFQNVALQKVLERAQTSLPAATRTESPQSLGQAHY